MNELEKQAAPAPENGPQAVQDPRGEPATETLTIAGSEAALAESAQQNGPASLASKDGGVAPPVDVSSIVNKALELTTESPEVVAMANDARISPEAALAVHTGQTTLARAIANSQKRDRLYRLATESALPHSLAGQVLKDQLKLEDAVVRTKVIENRRLRAGHCSFTAAALAKTPVLLGLYGQKQVRASILEVLQYDIRYQVEDQEPCQIPKHEVKYLLDPEQWRAVRKLIREDKQQSKNPSGPIVKVAQRFRVTDDALQKIVDLRGHLAVILLEGERVQGEIELYSRYEVVLKVRDDARMTVFRHALAKASMVPMEELAAAERYLKKMQRKGGETSAAKSQKPAQKKSKRR